MNYKIWSLNEDFEFPIVMAKYAIEHLLRELFISIPDVLTLDLGKKYDIFQEFIPPGYIEGNEVKYVTENLLNLTANAYKWIDEDNLYILLEAFAKKLRNKSLGGIIPTDMYKYYVILL